MTVNAVVTPCLSLPRPWSFHPPPLGNLGVNFVDGAVPSPAVASSQWVEPLVADGIPPSLAVGDVAHDRFLQER
jgi:hypothetical protein